MPPLAVLCLRQNGPTSVQGAESRPRLWLEIECLDVVLRSGMIMPKRADTPEGMISWSTTPYEDLRYVRVCRCYKMPRAGVFNRTIYFPL